MFFRKPFFTDYARITVKADICNPLRYLPDSVKRFPLALFEFHFDNQKHAQHNAFPYTFFLFHLLSPPLRELRGAELGGRDLAVNVTVFHQLFVRADAHGLAAVEHDDLVCVADGADALRDDDLRRVVQLLG